jgi:Ser/Thr protein kinase RdoA (MazF antagonist)
MQLTPGFVSQHWPLDEVRIGRTLQVAEARNTVALQSAQGHFVVKTYDNLSALTLNNPTQQTIRECLYVFEFLQEKRFQHCPQLWKTRSGETFVRTETDTAILLERIEGSHPRPTATLWAEVGHVLAKLNALTDFPHPYPIEVLGCIEEMRQWAEEYPFREEYVKLVDRLEVLADQPASLIHGEAHNGNFLRTPDGRIYLLDMDNMGTSPTVLEAGFPLIGCFLDEPKHTDVPEEIVFHRSWAQAFYEAYTGGVGMSEAQKELVFTGALLHALRYIHFGGTLLQRWSRICYALEHKDRLLAAIPSQHEGRAVNR